MNRSMKHFLLVFCLVAGGAWHASGGPLWWASRGVTANGSTNDYAAANAGQVKWMAYSAAAEFDAVLPGGAGPEIAALVAGFSATNNYLAVNVGQLKAVGQLFYDRLTDVGYVLSYPWSTTTADDTDYALVNIGQLKNVFSFDPGVDSAALGTALNATGFAWITGGHADWASQALVTHDGTNALRSGAVGNDQWTWVQASFTGPGVLAFWWNVSSESGFDGLVFSLDDEQKGSISGNAGWQHKRYRIPPGVHAAKWEYIKNTSTSAGSDCAWLDQVTFVADDSGPLSWLLLLLD